MPMGATSLASVAEALPRRTVAVRAPREIWTARESIFMPRAIAPIHSRTRKAVVPLRKAIAPKRNSPSSASLSAASSSSWSGPLMRPKIHRRRS